MGQLTHSIMDNHSPKTNWLTRRGLSAITTGAALISLVACTSSGTFEWKSDRGTTYYIEKEDVRCDIDNGGKPPRTTVYCGANGYSVDLAGKKKAYSLGLITCAEESFYGKSAISGRNENFPAYNAPNKLNCAAALHFGLYKPLK